jgi:glycosyltransferase involved in cell wall biosynthesis
MNFISKGHEDVRWYDVVIPNYFDKDTFTYSGIKDDYFLYIGRLTDAKGIIIAIQVTKAINATLIVAGQGDIDLTGYDHVKNVGYMDITGRQKLLSGAKAVFTPTQYSEPFCGVMVEALLSGTPVISTDWGAFTENNIHGKTGYRCRTFEQFVWAANNIGNIDNEVCYKHGLNFTLEKVSVMYEEYFSSILDIYNGNGWYELKPGRTSLNTLDRFS